MLRTNFCICCFKTVAFLQISQTFHFCFYYDSKLRAVAEMGDRARAKWAKMGATVPLSMEEAGSPSNTMSPEPRPTYVPSGILIHQLSDHNTTTLRQTEDNGPIAQENRFTNGSPTAKVVKLTKFLLPVAPEPLNVFR